MSYLSETYTKLSARLELWLQTLETEGTIDNLPLDLLNRAQNWLLMYRPWSERVVDVQLSITDRVATLPTDCISILDVGIDANSDGKIDYHFYRDAQMRTGYKIRDTFDKATGRVKTMTFFAEPTDTVILKYYQQLEDFVGTEDTTEISFFPGELLLKTAQRIHIMETGLSGAEIAQVLRDHQDLLNDYTEMHQHVNPDQRIEMLDDIGNEIYTEAYGLNTGGYFGRHNDYPSNDRSFLPR